MSFTRLAAFAAVNFLLGQLALAQPSLLNQVEQGLQGTPGYLGAELDDAGEDGRGVRVKAVRPGSPADTSGLKSNDLIVSVDGKKIGNLDDYDSVAKRPVGAKLVFLVDRGGKQQSLAVMLGTRSGPTTISDQPATEAPSGAPGLAPPTTAPSSAPPTSGSFGSGLQSPASPSLLPPSGGAPTPSPSASQRENAPRTGGITAQPLDSRPPGPDSTGTSPLPSASVGGASLGITVGRNDQVRGAPSGRRGAHIADVKPGSPAGIAGLPIGGVIVKMDNRQINSDDDLVAAIRAARPGQEVELTFYDNNDRIGKKMVRLAEAGAPSTASAPGGFTAPGIGGGFGSAFNPGSTTGSPEPSSSPSSRPTPGSAGGSTRPLINRVERMAENLSRGTGLVPTGPTGPTTVYDPLVMAALQKSVAELGAAVSSLEERLRALEGRSGVTSPSGGASGGTSPSPFGTPPSPLGSPSSPGTGFQTPGFSSPQPLITPGFNPSTSPPSPNP